MIIVNFTHPLTEQQQVQVARLTREPIEAIRDVPCQFDNQEPFAGQVSERVDAVDLSTEAWQQAPILINPPAFAPAAAILIAELHGRMGYFPAFIRMRPVPGSSPTQFEVGEIINLQAVRDKARTRRLNAG
jgi:hypothetical protein